LLAEPKELLPEMQDVPLDRDDRGCRFDAVFHALLDFGELLFEQAEFFLQQLAFVRGTTGYRGADGAPESSFAAHASDLRGSRGISRELFLAKLREVREIDKLAENARVLNARFIEPIEFAIRFTEPEDGLRGAGALAIELRDDAFVFARDVLRIGRKLFVHGDACDIPSPGETALECGWIGWNPAEVSAASARRRFGRQRGWRAARLHRSRENSGGRLR
jgi:hypothetical protein